MEAPALHKPLSAEYPWPEQGMWTYEDWLRLPDDGYRYEILEGELFMSPPPKVPHQRSSRGLFVRMCAHAAKHNSGEVFCAPIGVRIPGQKVPLQPDILFVKKNRSHIVEKDYIEGAPDLIVEILSPSNWTLDRREKFQAYQAAEVPEYWIVDYRAKTIEVFILESKNYVLTGKFGPGETVRATQMDGFSIQVDEVFSS